MTRARIPGLLHFLLSQPSQRNEKSGPFSTLKLKTKTTQKTSYTSTKTSEILTKTWEFFEKTWEIFSKMSDVFLETLGNPPNSTKTLRPLSHKNRGKESHLPKTSLLPSTFFYRKHRKSVSHSAPKSPISALDFPFSASIPLTSAKKHA